MISQTAPSRLPTTTARPCGKKKQKLADLFVEMEDQDDDSETDDRREQDDRHPRDPVARFQIQLFPPLADVAPLAAVALVAASVLVRLVREDQDLRVWNDAFEVDKVLTLPRPRRTDEEVLDVIVGAPEAEVCVRQPEREVRRRCQLSVYGGKKQSPVNQGDNRRNHEHGEETHTESIVSRPSDREL